MNRQLIPFVIGWLSIALGAILQPNEPTGTSVYFYIFAITILFGLLNIRFGWIKDK